MKKRGREYRVSVECVEKCVGEVRGDVGVRKIGGICGRLYGVRVGKCVGVWGRGGERYGGVGKVRRDGECEEVWGNVWESVWGKCGGSGKVCWGVGEVRGEVWGV